jgi:hypothetical protein
MPLYTYPPASAVAEIELCQSDSGGFRAYLSASAQATPEQLQAIKVELAEHHDWVCLSHYRHGKPVLEVRGFEKPQDLESVLRKTGALSGPAHVTQMPSDHRTLWKRLANSTLKGSGFAYVVGDTAFMTYAGMEQWGHFSEKKEIAKLIVELDTSGIETRVKTMPVASQQHVLDQLRADHHIVSKYIPEDDTLAVALSKLKKLPEAAKDNVKGGWFKIASGIGYAIGSFILATYGSRDQAQAEIKNSVQKIDRYIKKERLFPAEAETILTQETGKKKRGIRSYADGLLKRYPSEALNIVYTGVGLALMRSSFKHIKGLSTKINELKVIPAATRTVSEGKLLKSLEKDRVTEGIDVGLGTVTAGSALAGLLITERKPVEGEKEPKSFLGRVWRKIQSQPLIATGYGFMVATGFHAIATVHKWYPNEQQQHALDELKTTGNKIQNIKPASQGHIKDLRWNQKVVIGRAIFVALNVVAEFLMAFSSKGHGIGVNQDRSTHDSVITATAEFIASQPKAQQELLIQRLSGYMSAPDILDEKTDAIASKLREQIANYPYNPWSVAGPEAQAVANVENKLVSNAASSSHSPSMQIQAAKAQVSRLNTRSLQEELSVL